MLDLSNKTPRRKTIDQHRNICVILGILADKLPGPSSIALLTKDTLTYLFNNMVSTPYLHHQSSSILKFFND